MGIEERKPGNLEQKESNVQKILLWGTGQVAEETLTKCLTLDQYDIQGCIDSNCEKTGDEFHGFKVYAPDVLDTVTPEKIVIVTDAYEAVCEQIKTQFPHLLSVVEDKYYFYKQSILQRYGNTDDEEIKSIIACVRKNGLQVFNYDFSAKYNSIDVTPVFDEEKRLFYVVHKGKKMYFSKSYNSAEKAAEYYKYLLMEQDMESPHRYLTETFCIDEGDVVVDVGVAEGNFSLEIVDKVEKLYLIEADDDWIEAIRATFSDYGDKVIIIKAFVSDYDEGKFSSLDTLIKEPVNFIKLDIEGNEWDALCGAKKLIGNSQKLRIAACVYHQDADQVLIEALMDEYGMSHEASGGYMWFPESSRQAYISTKLHRGLVRGSKE